MRWLWAASISLVAALAACHSPDTVLDRNRDALGPVVPIASLPGWNTDHIADMLPPLMRECARLALTPPDQLLGGSAAMTGMGGQAGDWIAVCTLLRSVPHTEADARAFLAKSFDAYRITDAHGEAGLFTGYYEPELDGSREQNRLYHVPVLSPPNDLVDQASGDRTHRVGRLQHGELVPYYTRAEIDAGALRGQRLDILYLKSPIDLFFLQIQGSGRIDLPNGHVVRLGYAATNGQPYVPIGRVLEQRGDLASADISAQSIQAWLQAHPQDARGTMELNPSYVFFKEVPGVSPDAGPLGSLGVQLTPMRSIAIDANQVPLGAPVWIDTTNVDGSRLQQLMLAQDTGTAVSGAVRADIFFGWGQDAQERAGRLHEPGRAWLLLPKPLLPPGARS